MGSLRQRRLVASVLGCAAAGAAADYSEPEALELAQFARASFCDPAAIESWNCGEPCESVARPKAVRVLGPGVRLQGQGLVAQVGTDGKCVVAFRGSVTAQNWMADAKAALVRWPNQTGETCDDCTDWCAGCLVHKGFAMSYAELRPMLMSAIRDLQCTLLTVTGHSLGGAVATLATMELRAHLNITTHPLITFGSPRVGEATFVAAFESAAAAQGLEVPSWRLVHFHDPVPQLPPRVSIGGHEYSHVPREVFYTLNSGSYKVCDASGEDKTCSDSASLFDIINFEHLKYLNLSFEHNDLPAQCRQPEPLQTVV